MRFRCLMALVVGAGLVVTGSVSAQAVPARSSVEVIASHVVGASADAIVAPTRRADRSYVTEAHETSLSVPATVSSSLTLRHGSASGPSVSVRLPKLAGLDAAQVTGDGTFVYSSDADASLAVRSLADGTVRFLSIVQSPRAPQRYAYDLGDVRLTGEEDGSVLLQRGDIVIGEVEAPWAYDASGAAVPTRYEIEGGTLTQVVDHTSKDFVYPITADPKISFGTKIYIRYSKAETKRYAGYTAYGTISAAVCVFLTVPFAQAACIAALTGSLRPSIARSTRQLARASVSKSHSRMLRSYHCLPHSCAGR